MLSAWLYPSLETAHINTTAGWAGASNQLVSLICIRAPDSGQQQGEAGEGPVLAVMQGHQLHGPGPGPAQATAQLDPHHHDFSRPIFILNASFSEYKFLALKLQLLGCTRRSSSWRAGVIISLITELNPAENSTSHFLSLNRPAELTGGGDWLQQRVSSRMTQDKRQKQCTFSFPH